MLNDENFSERRGTYTNKTSPALYEKEKRTKAESSSKRASSSLASVKLCRVNKQHVAMQMNTPTPSKVYAKSMPNDVCVQVCAKKRYYIHVPHFSARIYEYIIIHTHIFVYYLCVNIHVHIVVAMIPRS